MHSRLTIVRKSKIEKILNLLQANNNSISLKAAAKAIYGSEKKEAQEKVIRLLSMYRLRGKTDLHVRNGRIVNSK